MPKALIRKRFLLPLALLAASWQFVASPLAQAVIISPDVVANRSLNGADCIGPQNQDGQTSQYSLPPDLLADIEDNDTELNDLRARNDQGTPHSPVIGVRAETTRMPRIVPILLFPAHCFYCLHEHIRERAPPIPE